jgi:ribulose-5-phosphate 4-epimerase/fuculose-1-phosphate aldolase
VQATPSELAEWVSQQLLQRLKQRGARLADAPSREGDGGGLVLHLVDTAHLRGYRRKTRAVYVASIAELPEPPQHPLKAGYPILIRTLSNLLILVCTDSDGPRADFVTMEQGYYTIRHGGDDDAFFEELADRLMPLAESHLIIDNEFHDDLPEALWNGDEHVEQIYRAGVKLEQMDLLPAPFPVEQFVSPDDYRHVRRLFGIGKLSYGNLSSRKDATSYWMSASGVDKSHLRTVGKEVLLVTGYNEETKAMILSVPRGVEPNRVSVDAIEHYMIYREHPGVGAILHIHAWIDGIPSTHVNYPCGTYELAVEVADLVREQPDPTRAIIGLRNHGMTITGHSLQEIFSRIDGKVQRQVPMS